MLLTSDEKKCNLTSYITPPYNNIFGLPFDYQQLSLPVYYSFTACTSSSDMPFPFQELAGDFPVSTGSVDKLREHTSPEKATHQCLKWERYNARRDSNRVYDYEI